MQRSEVILTAYGGTTIIQFGTIVIPCQYKGRRFNCIFYVTDAMGPAILGIKACRALELVSLHCALETKVVHGNEVPQDVSQGFDDGEVKSYKDVRFADHGRTAN